MGACAHQPMGVISVGAVREPPLHHIQGRSDQGMASPDKNTTPQPEVAESRESALNIQNSAFRTPHFALRIGAVLAFSALLLFLAYQSRPSYAITVGTPTDSPLYDGFWDPERTPGENPPYKTYRWSRGYGTITFRDIGTGPYRVSLTLNAARPPGIPPAHLEIKSRDTTLLNIDPAPALSTYTFTVP